MGIQDILRGASSSAASSGAGGYTSKDVKLASEMERRLSNIEKLIKKSSASWGKMAEAEPLLKAKNSLAAFNKQQKAHQGLMSKGNVAMSARVASWARMTKARDKAIKDTKEYNKVLNEQNGIMGRAREVMNEFPVKLTAIAAGGRAAKIVLGDMNQGFNAMARSGQVAGKTLGELAVSTGNFMVAMELGALSAARFGIAPKESNKAFAKLTETFGGTGEAVRSLSSNWESLAQIGAVSGLGMTAVTDLVAQNFKKVGGTIEQAMEAAKNQVAEMSTVTSELNARFGQGSVNTAAFASAINDLAFGASFMNQNSRMLTETLGRELQMQLALGKAPDAAMAAAKKNVEMAGKVNIVGIQEFRKEIKVQYDAALKEGKGAEYLKDLGKQFGSQGEIIANMLETKTLMDSKNLFAFQEAVDQSTGLRTQMLDDMRSAAAGGDVGTLIARGLGIREAQYMVAEADLLTTKVGKLNQDGKINAEAAEDLFGKDWEDDEKAMAFITKAGKGETSMRELHKEFRSMPGAGKKLAEEAAAATDGGKQPWEKYVGNTTAAGLAAGITGSIDVISELMTGLPGAILGIFSPFLIKLALGMGLARAIPIPGSAGAVGMGARMAKAMPTFARAGGGIMKGVGALGGFAGKALGGLGKLLGKAGPIGLAISAIAGFGLGMAQASEIFRDVDVGAAEYAAAGIGGAVNMLTMGLIDTADAAHTAMDLGGFVKSFFTGDPLAPTAADSAAPTEEGMAKYKAIRDANKAGKLPPTGTRVVQDATVSSGDAGSGSGESGGAIAAGSLSGKSLILEVQNWDAIYAQSVNEAVTRQ